MLLLSGCLGQRVASNFISLTGRVEPGPTLVWSGTRAAVRFDGTGATVAFEEAPSPVFEAKLTYKNKYRFLVDGKLVAEAIAPQPKWRWSTPALAAGEHLLEIVKETEAGVGVARLDGIWVQGEALAAPARPTRRLEFIGDSHTVGFGATGVDPCPFSSETESQSGAFAAQAAEALQAEAHVIGWSGRGVTRNYDDDRLPETAPQMWRRTLPFRPEGWVPDAVVVNLGANDFGRGDPGSAFTAAFAAFLQELRSTYPNAFFLVVGRAHKEKLSEYLQAAMLARAAAGDLKATLLVLPKGTPEEGKGCVGHATLATHTRHAALVVGALRAALGWDD